MDPSKIRIVGIMVVDGQLQQPPPPHLVPHLLRAAEARQRYHIAARATIGMMLMALFWVVLGFTAKDVLMVVLGVMLFDTGVYGFAKWLSGRALAQAMQKGPPE